MREGGKIKRGFKKRNVYKFSLGINKKRLSLSVKFFEMPEYAQIFTRLAIVVIVFVLAVTYVIPYANSFLANRNYTLTNAEKGLIPASDPVLQKDISYSQSAQGYEFQNTAPNRPSGAANAAGAVSSDESMLSATLPSDPSQGVAIKDPINNVTFTETPEFSLKTAQQDSSHVYYSLADGSGHLVYSPQASNVLEDLVLTRNSGNSEEFDYNLNLGSNFAAKLQKDGSVNIYGSSLSSVLGNAKVDAADQARVAKAEARATKDKLLFTIPAPSVKETARASTKVKAHYELADSGNILKLVATNLNKASYPIDIDPTVTVQSVSQIYRDTNAESNIDFDSSNGTISRGAISGGVVNYTNSWATNTNSLGTARFLASSVVSNGYVYTAGGAGSGSTTNFSSVEFAQINTSNNTVGTFSTTTALPGSGSAQELSEFKLLQYNGYIYVLGGSTGTTGCSTRTSDVWFNPTQPNGYLASSWTAASNNLPAGICGFGAGIYDNYIYVVGGQTGTADTSATTTVYWAPLLPDGDVGSWSTSTSANNLPAALYDEDVQIYNGRIYAIGGINSSGTVVKTIYEAPLLSSGGLYAPGSGSAWTSVANSFTNATVNVGITNMGGGSFTAVNDGYMYVSGGCTAVTIGTPTCTAVQGNSYVTQINADGSLGEWQKIAVTNIDSEVGGSMDVFAGYLYLIGGCTAMNGSNYYCATGDVLSKVAYAQIETAGQIGPVANDAQTIPAGMFQDAAVVADGYLIIIGGCITLSCQTGTGDTSDAVYYAPISSSGTLSSAFTTSHVQINNANTNTGLGAIDEAVAVYDNYIYIFGGYNYGGGTTANGFSAATSESGSNVIWYTTVNSVLTASTATNFSMYTTTKLTYGEYSMSAVDDGSHILAYGGCIATYHAAGCSTYYYEATNTYSLSVGASGPISLTASASSALTDSAGTGNEVAACKTATPAPYTDLDCCPGDAAIAIAYYSGYVYLIGGADTCNGQSVIIQYGQVSSSGGVSTWNFATDYLPTALRRSNAEIFNGYLYVIGGHDGDTSNVHTLQTIEIGAIDMSNGDLDAASTSDISTSNSQLITDELEWNGGVAFGDGTVYVAGGCYNGAPPTTCSNTGYNGLGTDVQEFQIYNADNNGTAAWSNSSNVPSVNTVGAGSVAYNGYIYVAGGCTTYTQSTGLCTASDAHYYYAALNPDGTIGSWTQGTLSGGAAFGCLLQANGYLYYIGGQTASGTLAGEASRTNIYYSAIGSNGVPGTFNSTTDSLSGILTNGLTQMGCDSYNGVLFLGGGISATAMNAPTYENNIYYVVPSNTGDITSAWSSYGATTFTNTRAGDSLVAAAGYLYVIGGYNGTTYYGDIQSIGFNPSTGASSGSWTSTQSIPYPTAFMSTSVANGYITLTGGNTGTATTSCTNSTYIAPLVSTGALGNWSQGVNNITTARMGAAGAYYDGYYYVIGGDACNAGGVQVIASNQDQLGGQQSQSMQSFFTRYADLAGDAAPELFLSFVTNAQTDGFNVEYWQAQYETSTFETNSWGIWTTIPNLTSGTVTNVYAYNGSGANVYLNRYLELSFSINQTKSFTFPDTSPPSVNSYFVYYSPAPQTRLRNGMDFQDEQQQGFDLNY